MQSECFVGIDLGTVNSTVAYSNGGDIELIPDSHGSTVWPSVIMVTERGKYIGNDAKEYVKANEMEDDPSVIISGFKRQMGTDHTRIVGSRNYTSTELSAILLRKLLMSTEAQIGSFPKKAVITVPGAYGDIERNATMEAGKIAGLSEVVLLNEPVAAALAYGLGGNHLKDSKIIVFDLGGGTFDVSVLEIHGTVIKVLSTESSRDIGGKDWDIQLASILQKKIIDAAGLTFSEVDRDCALRRRIIQLAEKHKEDLTYNEKFVGTIDINGVPIVYTLRRSELEDNTESLMARTVEMTGAAVRNAGLQLASIDQILLVGGASRMPMVMRALEDAYPSADILLFDPEHAVARGAALYAETMFGKKDLNVTNVLTRSFGVCAGVDGEERICNVLFRNIPLPMEKTIMCRPKRDDQESLDVEIYETRAKAGEEFSTFEDARLVSKFSFQFPSRASRGKTRIAIHFRANADGRMSVDVECGGKSYECDFYADMELSQDELMDARQKLLNIV